MDTSNQILEAAVGLHKNNDLKNAENKYREYLKANPKNSQCLFMLGTLLIQEKKYKSAIIEIKKSIKEDSKNYHYYHNLGIAYFEDRQFKDAIDAYKKSLSLNDKNHDAYNNLGNSLHQTQQFKEAIINFTEAIKLAPNTRFLLNRAQSFRSTMQYHSALDDLNNIDESSILFRKAEDIKATIYDAVNNFDKSAPIYESRLKSYEKEDEDIKKRTSKESLYTLLIAALMNTDNGKTKVKKYTNEFEKEFPGCIGINRIKAHQAFNDKNFEVALKFYKEVIKLDPKKATVYADMGGCYESLGDLETAKAHFRQCLDLDSKHVMANVSFGISLLKDKKFTQAWPYYEYRLMAGSFRTHKLKYIFYNTKLPKWDGANNKSSVLIYGEQGVGDQIILAKLLTKIRGFQNKFSIVVENRLLPIFKRAFPDTNFNFISASDNVEGFFDYQAAIFRLGFLFVHNEEHVRFPDKYFLANKLNIKKSSKLRCGLSWNSKNPSIGDLKNLNLTDIIKATNVNNFDYVNLQYGDHEKEIVSTEASNNIQINRYNEIDKFKDIDGLFSLVDSCDVIITISNVTAHIAGSLGKKTYLILPFNRGTIWYWQRYKETNSSLWYPSVEIIQSTDPKSLLQCLEVLKNKLKNISS